MNRAVLRSKAARFFEQPVARLLSRVGFTPNSITVLGFLISCATGYAVAVNQLTIAGVLLFIAGAFDLLDGAIARLNGQGTKFGALLDSVLDRLGESAVFLGVLLLALEQDLKFLVVLTYLALLGSVMVSYARARAEGLGISNPGGIMTRSERVPILALGFLFDLIIPALLVITSLSFFTGVQRLVYSSRKLIRDEKTD